MSTYLHIRLLTTLVLTSLVISGCNSAITHDTETTANADSLSSASDNNQLPPLPANFVWTTLQPNATSRLIYISSSSGNDSNSCLSPETACATVARGKSLLRDGQPDYLYFKRGDVWYEPIGNWEKSGLSANEPMVVTYYGDSGDLPLFKTGTDHCFQKGNTQDISDVAFVGLDCIAHTRNYRSNEYVGPEGTDGGVRWINAGVSRRILIEGCRFQYYYGNIAFLALGSEKFSDIKLRGNVIAYSYRIGMNVQGVYLDNINNVTVEGNVFFHNGSTHAYPNDPHRVQLPGYTQTQTTLSWFDHNLYINYGTTGLVLVMNNYFIGGDGIHVRGGQPIIENNVLLRLVAGIPIGDSGVNPTATGMTGRIRRNVIAEGTDYPAESPIIITPPSGTPEPSPRANGILFQHIGDAGLTVAENIIMDEMSTWDGMAIQANGEQNCGGTVIVDNHCPVRRANIERNIVLNAGGLQLQDENGTLLTNTTLQNNLLYAGNKTSGAVIEITNAYSAVDTTFANNRYFRNGTDGLWFMDGAHSSSGVTQHRWTLPEWQAISGEANAEALGAGGIDTSYKVYSYYQENGGSGNFVDMIEELLQQNKLHWNARLEASRVTEAMWNHYHHLLPE